MIDQDKGGLEIQRVRHWLGGVGYDHPDRTFGPGYRDGHVGGKTAITEIPTLHYFGFEEERNGRAGPDGLRQVTAGEDVWIP